MIKTINFSEFRDAFQGMRPDNFSYDGLVMLFDKFTGLEEELGEQIELDVIAICSEYSEYDSLKETLEQYDNINTLEELQEHTETEVLANGHVLIRDF